MAHSIQTLGEKAAIIHDADLIVIVCMMHLEVTSAPDKYQTLRPYVEHWKQKLATRGPGTIDLSLDEVFSSSNATVELGSALEAVNRRIQDYGKCIPGPLLKQICTVGRVYFSDDYPTASLIDAVRQIRNLLTEVEVRH